MQYLLTKEELENDYVLEERYVFANEIIEKKEMSNDAWFFAVREESQEIRDRIYARRIAILKEKRNTTDAERTS